MIFEKIYYSEGMIKWVVILKHRMFTQFVKSVISSKKKNWTSTSFQKRHLRDEIRSEDWRSFANYYSKNTNRE